MKITREQVDGVRKIYSELNTLTGDVNEKINLAKLNTGNKIKWIKNGKEVECEEKYLWDEVFHLGEECDAYKTLSAKYPDAFETVKKQKGKVVELNDFTIKNFGLKFNQVSMLDIFDIVESLIKLNNDEVANK